MSLYTLFYCQADGAVVAAEDVGVNRCRFQPVVEVGRGQEVVDAPSGVVLTGPKAVAPPRIDAFRVGAEDDRPLSGRVHRYLASLLPRHGRRLFVVELPL